MIRVLVWKEYREHRLVWLFVSIAATGGLFAVRFLGGAGTASALVRERQFLNDAAVVIVFATTIVYGLVCGAAMLAGEQENGTLAFLDRLGPSRMSIWAIKVLFGGFLCFAQLLVLLGATAALGLERSESVVWENSSIVLVTAVSLSFISGLFSSAMCRSLFAAFAFGVIVLALLIMSLAAIVWFAFPIEPFFALLVLVVPPMGLLVLSALRLCRVDVRRVKGQNGEVPSIGMTHALFWLVYRQGRWIALAVLCWAVLMGVLNQRGLLEFAPMVLGVLCGVAVFENEQRSEAQRFLAAQRFPLGCIWLTKVSCWFSLGIVAVAIMSAVNMLTVGWLNSRPTDSGVVMRLAVSCVVGFGVMFCGAQFFGLIFRQTSFALVVSLAFTVLLIGLPGSTFEPPVVAPPWPWVLVAMLSPIFLIAATRLAMRPWATNRMGEWRPLVGLCGCLSLTLGWGWIVRLCLFAIGSPSWPTID
jgi:hypothetical protein